MIRVAVVVAIVFVARIAFADSAADLRAAEAHLGAAEWSEAARLAGPIAKDVHAPRAERTEAWRVYGLALFSLGLKDEAEVALFEYLKLEPDAHLDPSLVVPEAVVFFEDVRARHAGELRRLRPHAVRKKRYAALNLLPPWGQFQNHQPVKAWTLAGAELVLLAADVTTYAILRSRCSPSDLTCSSPGSSRDLRTINLISGGLLVGAVVYGVIDGFVVYRHQRDPITTRVDVVAAEGGGMLIYGGMW